MDLTKEYIKMCEKATEIQSHKTEEHDYYFFPQQMLDPDYMNDGRFTHIMDKIIDTKEVSWYIEGLDARIIWLPRQDQLQEMSNLAWDLFDKECAKLIKFRNGKISQDGKGTNIFQVDWNKTVNITAQMDSKEQCGLKVVMEKLHNKTWDGTEWVECNEN